MHLTVVCYFIIAWLLPHPYFMSIPPRHSGTIRHETWKCIWTEEGFNFWASGRLKILFDMSYLRGITCFRCPCTLSSSFFSSPENHRSSWQIHTRYAVKSNKPKILYRPNLSPKMYDGTLSEVCSSCNSCRRSTRSSLKKERTLPEMCFKNVPYNL